MRYRVLLIMAVGLTGALPARAAEPIAVLPREVPAAARDVLLPPGAIRTFGDTRFRHPGGISGSALSPDGKRLATAAAHSVIIWDTTTGRAVCRMDTGDGGRWARPPLTFSPDGAKLAYGATNAVYVWDAATGRELKRFRDPRVKDEWLEHTFGPVVVFAPDGRQLVLDRLGPRPGQHAIEYYDTSTWALVRSSPEPAPAVISPAGPTAIGLDRDGSVVFSDPGTGRLVKRLNVASGGARLALSPDGKVLAIFRRDGAVEVRRVPSGDEVHSVPGPVPPRTSVGPRSAFTPDGKTVLVTRPTGIARLDLESGKELSPLPHGYDGRYGDPSTLHVLPDGDTLLVCGTDGLAHRWSLKTGKKVPRPDGYENWSQAAVAADGRVLAVEDRAGGVDLWDLTTGKRALTIRESTKGVTALAFSPDGRTLAVGRTTGEVEVRDLPAGPVRAKYQTTSKREEGQRFVSAVQFAPGGKVLLATSCYGRLEAWDLATGKRVWTGPDAEAFAISPDGKTLVSSLAGPNVVVSDAITGAERRRAKLGGKLSEGSGGQVPALAFAPDGRRLFIATKDQHIRVCDPLKAEERSAFVVAEPLKTSFGPQGSAPKALTFSPDGRWLVTGGDDRTVRVWEVDTKQEVRRFVAHDDEVRMVAFGPGARTVLSAGADGAVYEWDLRPDPAPPGRSIWDDLAAENAGVAYRATWSLINDPAEAVTLLRSKLPPAVAPKAEDLARLIDRLNATKFADREAASRALAEIGPAAGPALRAALDKGPPAEQRERLQKLLDHLSADPPPLDLRVLRAVQAIELAGTPSARRLLAEWAAGAPEARLTEPAKAALARLGTN
ncbi:MAG: PQQ-binding-like beta-propeller repeat protein [Zavarzinella sp.]|nr:PQQ-binding-like beta-propeller repeat protein [Zavarzinella sp.]